MFRKVTLLLLSLLMVVMLTNCGSSTSTKKKTTVSFTNVYWDEDVDADGDGYNSYAKLFFETEASKDDIDVFIIVGVRYASEQDTATYYIYLTSDEYVTGAIDAKYVQIGLPNSELAHAGYDFLIQMFEAGDPEDVLAEANLNSFSAMKAVNFETQDEDALPEMTVSTSTISFGSSSTSENFNVSNIGGGSLTWSISTNQSWLSVSPNSGSTSGGYYSTIAANINKAGLSPGNYNGTITIDPSHGANETINVSMTVENAGLTLTFTNPVFTDLDVTISGYGTKTASPGGNVVFNFATNPGSITLYAETHGQSSSGTRIGELVVWSSTLDVSSYTDHTYNMNVGATLFFIYITNSGYALNPLYVNYGRAEQTSDNIIIPADNVKYRTGYFKAFSDTKVLMTFQGYGSGVQWVQGTNFTLPWVVNQKAELTNSLSPGSAGILDFSELPEVAGKTYTLIPESGNLSKKNINGGEDLFSLN